MKTLSVRQPWANLIVHGIKDVENRSRRTNYRGRIYIHAPVKIEKENFLNKGRLDSCLLTGKFGQDGPFTKPPITSAIIGTVEIVDCVQPWNNGIKIIFPYESVWAEETGYNWILKDPILFDEPILNVKGKLGLWEYAA